MGHLHRTQIYIDSDQMQHLKLEARKGGSSVSLLIRIAIMRFLTTKAKNMNWDSDPLTKAIGKVKLPVSDASTRHDRYLYG